MHLLKKLAQHPFVRGSMIFTIATFVVNVLSYVFNLLIARGMSLTQYGEYSSSISYLSLLAVPFGTLGLIVIKKIGSVPQVDRTSYLNTFENKFFQFIRKYIIHSIIFSLIIILLMTTRGNLQLNTSIFVILAIWSTLFFTFYGSILLAFKEFWQSGVIQVIQGILKVVLGGLVIFLLPRLDLLYASLLLSTILGINLTKRSLPQNKPSAKEAKIPNMKNIVFNLEYYLPLITSLGTIGMINIDLILVKKFFPADEVGFYAAISLLGKIILYVSTPITAVAYTFFTGQENSAQKKKIFLLSAGGLVGIGLVSVLGYSLFSHLIVSIIFGNKFSTIHSMLTLAAIFGSAYSLMSIFSQYLLSVRSKFAMTSVLTFILQVLLIYRYHENFTQILYINIFCTIALFFIYALVWAQCSGVFSAYGKNQEQKTLS